jgi:MFS family permease
VIVVGGAVFCAGSLLSSFDQSLGLLYFSRFLTGLGAAAIYLSVLKEISRVVSASAVPLVLGIVTIIGYSGAITGASPFIAGVDRWGYTPMMLAAGGIMLFFYIIYIVISCREKLPPVCCEVRFSLSSYLTVFKSRQNVCLILSIGISFGTYFALQSIVGKKFLEDFCGMEEKYSGAVLTATMIIAALNGFVLANISRWVGNLRRPFMLFSGFGCFIGAFMILAAIFFDIENSAIPVVGMLLMAFAGNVSPIYVAMLKESNADNRFGTVACVGNCFAYAISAIFGGLAGVLMDVFPPQLSGSVKIYSRESYLLVFCFLAVLGVIAAVSAIFIRESRGRNIAGELK